jgi:hypothetical protein
LLIYFQEKGITWANRAKLPPTGKLVPACPFLVVAKRTVGFFLPEAAEVSLGIYDLNGRLVSILLNRKLPAGEHSVNFGSAHHAFGIYICKLKTDRAIIEKKIINVK